MRNRGFKNVALRTVEVGILAIFIWLLLWLLSQGPIYGIWIVGIIVSVITFLVCRYHGWLFVFVLPLSFVFFLFGIEDGSLKVQGISELQANRVMFLHFVAALVLMWTASLIGTIVWWRTSVKSKK